MSVSISYTPSTETPAGIDSLGITLEVAVDHTFNFEV